MRNAEYERETMDDRFAKTADEPSSLVPHPSSFDSSNSTIRISQSANLNPLASSFELEGMYRHLSEALQMMDFLDKQNPELWMMSLRRFFSRIGLYSNEVRMIRGICRQLKWFITRYRPQQDPLRPARLSSPKSQDSES
jgi:hypothetical protein